MKLADLQPDEEYAVRLGNAWGSWSRMRMIEIRTVQVRQSLDPFTMRSRPRQERAVLMERLQPDLYTVQLPYRDCQPDEENLVIVPARHVRHTWAERVEEDAAMRSAAMESERREQETRDHIERLTETLGIPMRRAMGTDTGRAALEADGEKR